MGGEQGPLWVLYGTLVPSCTLARERHYLVVSGDVASVSSEGPIQALFSHQGKAAL